MLPPNHSQPAPSLIATTSEELRHHAPFAEMETTALQYLATRLSLAYFAKGETLLTPGHGNVRTLFIVQKGLVQGRDPKTVDSGDALLTLAAGECFPIGALISRRASVLNFVAAEDSFCYQLPLEDFEHVMDVSRPFRDFATRRLAARSTRSAFPSASPRSSRARRVTRSSGSTRTGTARTSWR